MPKTWGDKPETASCERESSARSDDPADSHRGSQIIFSYSSSHHSRGFSSIRLRSPARLSRAPVFITFVTSFDISSHYLSHCLEFRVAGASANAEGAFHTLICLSRMPAVVVLWNIMRIVANAVVHISPSLASVYRIRYILAPFITANRFVCCLRMTMITAMPSPRLFLLQWQKREPFIYIVSFMLHETLCSFAPFCASRAVPAFLSILHFLLIESSTPRLLHRSAGPRRSRPLWLSALHLHYLQALSRQKESGREGDFKIHFS